MMSELALVLLCALLCCGVVWMVRRTYGEQIWFVLPPSMLVAYFVGKALPGVLLAVVDGAPTAAFTSQLVWLGGMCCALLALGLTSRALRKPGRVRDSALVGPYHGRVALFHGYIGLGVLSVIIMFALLGRIPLFLGVESLFGRGGDLLMHEARRLNTLSHHDGAVSYFGQGYFRRIYEGVAPIFVSALAVLWWRSSDAKRRVWVRFLMVAFVIFGALNGQIWVSVEIWLLFMASVLFATAVSRGRFVLSRVALRVLVGYVCVFAFALAFRAFQAEQGRSAVHNVFRNVVERIYAYEPAPLFAEFPDHRPFRHGSTWANDLEGLLPGPKEAFAYEVHSIVMGGGWGYTLSPGIVASGYVNFGFFGVFALGAFVTLLYVPVCASLFRRRSALHAACAVYLSVRFALGVDGDVISYVVPLLTVMSILVSYRILCGFANLAGSTLRGPHVAFVPVPHPRMSGSYDRSEPAVKRSAQ